MKILVIGSKDHFERADCIDWMQPFPNIEEYDALILNMETLDQNLFDVMMQKSPGRLMNMQEPVLTLLATGRNVYCFMRFYLVPSPPPGSGQAYVQAPPSNYDWMIVKPHLQLKEGESIQTVVEQDFNSYFKFVDRWGIEILGLSEIPLEKTLELSFSPVCTNKSNKIIASKIALSHKKGSGAIYLLPPPTKCDVYKGIELIIDRILGPKPTNSPTWWSKVEIPSLTELQSKYNDQCKTIQKLQEELIQIQRKIKEAESYRDLLSETGDTLVDIVRKVLGELGIVTKLTNAGFPVDLIKEGEVAVEVTGVADKIDSDTDKIFQITRFKDNFCNGEKILLVANTYRRLPPEKRKGKMDFTPEVKDFLRLKQVCALTSLSLYEIWKSSYGDKKKVKKARELILGFDGVLDSLLIRRKTGV